MGYNKDIDWQAIYCRYVEGETPYGISKDLGGTPTKQAIMYRAKTRGWQQAKPAKGLVTVNPGEVMQFDDPRKAVVVAEILDGATHKLAGAVVGVTDDTITNWKKADKEFSEAITAARARRLIKHEQNIDKAGDQGDWKASLAVLERDPMSKGQYKQQEAPGTAVQINIGIDRDEVKIG